MLSKEFLRASLSPFFRAETMPRGSVAECVRQWGVAYAGYANFATAGVAKLTLPLNPIGVGGQFFQAIDTSFRTMWMTANWIGPGVTGTTATVPPLVPILSANAQTLMQSRDPQQALTLIVEALHTYTLSVTVALVTAAGTPTTVPVV